MDGAYIYTIDSLGLDIRTQPFESGAVIGYGRRNYVYPMGGGDSPLPGSYRFYIPVPPCPPLVIDTRSFGLEVQANAREFGLNLGIRATTVMAQVDADQSLQFELYYSADEPEETILRFISGSASC